MLTRSAITPPKVNRFGWNLEQREPNVGLLLLWQRCNERTFPIQCGVCPITKAFVPISLYSGKINKWRKAVPLQNTTIYYHKPIYSWPTEIFKISKWIQVTERTKVFLRFFAERMRIVRYICESFSFDYNGKDAEDSARKHRRLHQNATLAIKMSRCRRRWSSHTRNYHRDQGDRTPTSETLWPAV